MSKIMPLLINSAVSFFFLSLLLFKSAYNIAPVFLAVLALGSLIYLLIKKQKISLEKCDKLLIYSYVFYFLTFLLSLILHSGKLRELDLPSRLLLFIPVLLLLFRYPPSFRLLSLVLPFSTIILGIIALYDRLVVKIEIAYGLRMMHIQAGGIAMTLSLFTLVMMLYFSYKKQKKLTALCFVAMLFGMMGAFLSTARGAWLALPICLVLILFCYRRQLSRGFFAIVVGSLLIGFTLLIALPQTHVASRFDKAVKEVQIYFEKGTANTSVGSRLEMWKSALLMAKEKPVFGWGAEGIKLEKKRQIEQKIIPWHLLGFDHAHNQYLDDLSKRGLVGLIALLAIFMIPLRHFILHLSKDNIVQHTVAVLGITHVVATMCYCLSQGFLTHNSGTIFYFFLIVLFYAMLKCAKYGRA